MFNPEKTFVSTGKQSKMYTLRKWGTLKTQYKQMKCSLYIQNLSIDKEKALEEARRVSKLLQLPLDEKIQVLDTDDTRSSFGNEEGDHYIYMALVDGIPRYIGKGKGNRYLHTISGASSCKALNKAYFEGRSIRVCRHNSLSNMSEYSASKLEKYLISATSSILYNIEIFEDIYIDDDMTCSLIKSLQCLMASEDYTEVNGAVDNEIINRDSKYIWFSIVDGSIDSMVNLKYIEKDVGDSLRETVSTMYG